MTTSQTTSGAARMSMLCDVYKTSKKESLYLYVKRSEGLKRVPEDLLQKFAEPELALTFELKEGRKLAKEDTKLVIKHIEEQGYHLQMPPTDLGARLKLRETSNHTPMTDDGENCD